MFSRVRKLLEMIRFSHTLFALPFALLSALLAWQEPDSFRWLDCVGILLCMVFARSAAMAFNRLADRRYDAANPRPATRPQPADFVDQPSEGRLFLVNVFGAVALTPFFQKSARDWGAGLRPCLRPSV